MSDIPPVSNGPLPENQIPENQTAAYKAARMAVIILSVLIVAAVAALVIGGIAKMSKTAKPAATGTFQLPAGARIVDVQTQPGRLILRVRETGGEEIDIIDIQDGKLIGRIKAGFGDPRSATPAR